MASNIQRSSASIRNKVKDRKKPTRRGKPTGAKAGDYKSILQAILHADTKFLADCANSLSDIHKVIMDMAMKRGDHKEIGIKDQMAAIKIIRDLMNDFIIEHYETCDERVNEEGEVLNSIESMEVAELEDQEEASKEFSLISFNNKK